MRPAVSVVIPTHGRSEWLRECLTSLARQEHGGPSYEVIVVDDGSPAGDAKEAAICGVTWPFPFTYLRQDQRGPAAARNRGVAHARAKVVAFTDDDAVVDSTWVRCISCPLRRVGLGGVAGKTLSYRVESLVERYLDHVHHLSHHHLGNTGELVYAITVNAAFPRKVLEEVNGFDETYPFPSGEDMDLGFRIRARGYRLVQNEDALVRHRQRESFTTMWRTWFIYGRGAFMCAVRNPTVATGGVTSGSLVEPNKVLRVLRTTGDRLWRDLTSRDRAVHEAVAFPLIEVSNHCCYQLGRIWEWAAEAGARIRRADTPEE
jgi:glycosyltransferase involved in cell wall biosynthesis